MRTVVKRRTRTPQERLQAVDRKLAKLAKDQYLTAETKTQIRDFRAHIADGMLAGDEVQRVVVNAGNVFFDAIRFVQKYGDVPFVGV